MDEDSIARIVTTWIITLEKQGCQNMILAGKNLDWLNVRFLDGMASVTYMYTVDFCSFYKE